MQSWEGANIDGPSALASLLSFSVNVRSLRPVKKAKNLMAATLQSLPLHAPIEYAYVTRQLQVANAPTW
jgi:hypothetical protein